VAPPLPTLSVRGSSDSSDAAPSTRTILGRPRTSSAASLLSLEPRTLRVGRGGATLAVTARRSPHASAGDHPAIVLLTATAPGARGVLVRMRIGLVVSVRIPGALVHRVILRSARVVRQGTRHRIDLTLVNHGNVIEHVDRASLRVVLLAHGKVVAVLRPERRDLLPRSSGLVAVPCPLGLRGAVVARVELRRAPRVVRRFHLRL